jgi:hypothetical protein
MVKIKELLGKLSSGLPDEKVPLITELEAAINEALDQVRVESQPPPPRPEERMATLHDKYQEQTGTKRKLFSPEVAPAVPHPQDYTDVLPRK